MIENKRDNIVIDNEIVYQNGSGLQILEEPQYDLFIEDEFLNDKTNDREINHIVSFYEEFENEYPINVINKKQFNTPVNFKQAKLFPRHRWYTYKEGFSPQFVEDFITRFSKNSEDVIFDPFGGIGTTVLQSSFLNHESFSNDINPLSNFITSSGKVFISSNTNIDHAVCAASYTLECSLYVPFSFKNTNMPRRLRSNFP